MGHLSNVSFVPENAVLLFYITKAHTHLLTITVLMLAIMLFIELISVCCFITCVFIYYVVHNNIDVIMSTIIITIAQYLANYCE